MRSQTLLLLAVATALTSCAIGPDYQRPAFNLPTQWPWQKQAASAESKIPQDWWKQFNDPVLANLVEEGLAANKDLVVAAAQVTEARASLRVDKSYLYPSLSAQGSATRGGGSKEDATANYSSAPVNVFDLSGVLSYELDLWGRLRRATEAGRARLLAAEDNREAVRLALTSDIATGYFSLRALDAQVQVTEDTVKSRREALEYQQKKFNNGMLDILTLRQAEAELAATEAQLPTLQQARAEMETALSVLLGREPDVIAQNDIPRGAQLSALPVPPSLPETLPSTLLQRRPDVQRAEQQLIASNAVIGIAKADYFPTLSLTGLLGLQSTDANRLLQGSARTWQAGATTAMPLLNAGRTSGNVDIARAQNTQAMAAYQQTVQAAFKEVLDSMNATHTSATRTGAQQRQVTAAQDALRVANLRYNTGYSDYLTVLDTQRQLFTAQLNLIDAQRQQLANIVTLYKAVGGGWQAPADIENVVSSTTR